MVNLFSSKYYSIASFTSWTWNQTRYVEREGQLYQFRNGIFRSVDKRIFYRDTLHLRVFFYVCFIFYETLLMISSTIVVTFSRKDSS